MIPFSGCKGAFFNVILALVSYLLSNSGTDKQLSIIDLPLELKGLLVILLAFEVKASKYLISRTFIALNPQQNILWNRFSQSCLFGIMLLFNVIWRSYCKMTYLVIPVIYQMGQKLIFHQDDPPWQIQFFIYVAGAGIVFGEILIIRYTLEPVPQTKSAVREMWSRSLVLIYTAYFSIFLGNLLTELTSSTGPSIITHLPQLILFYFFFYLPFRWVEVLSDLAACKNPWQQWVWGFTSFGAMMFAHL